MTLHADRPAAVFFDLDGTLIDHSAAARAAAGAFYEAIQNRTVEESAEAFAMAWRQVQERHYRRYLRGEITFSEQRRARIRALVEDLSSDAEADELFAAYLQHYEDRWAVFDDVIPCLDHIECDSLGVITNGDPEQQRKKLVRTGLLHRFETVVCSGAVGYSKPDARIFRHACRAIGAEPGRAIHIGDSFESDYTGSRGAGLHGVLLTRQPSTEISTSVHRASSLREVPALVHHLMSSLPEPSLYDGDEVGS